MGISIFKRSCYTNSSDIVVAPNPNPSQYEIITKTYFRNATLLKVKYKGCTNFEGVKILVYYGKFEPSGELDPHFAEGVSPIARFKPTKVGFQLATKFCEML